ncbi:MAG TPA: xanthine dehydrogenase [Candidatus Atribacteria bacterium]|uniref:Aldehyde oxidase and xanthine dehydrogenase molybdopterin binding protein n=1 Tax=candidate division TA06 bacterium 34_109 TaxID=1635277 RepID=A0A101I0B9_UNCT6|nr:MAG: Aldehyde oxidase and xanthine dehydrogenase molybdopterin binding protein [candidate division TA06 bacterium 34_109]HBY57677.1 xanthine dehydrogenase [Candidatus Atribacteria bacterium]
MYKIVNKSVERIDVYEKVTGKAKYGADLNCGSQLYAKTVYSRYPHAKILKIDTKEAEGLEGVIMVITAKDVPGNNIMFGKFPVLAQNEVKYIGDGVAVVAAESKEIAEKAAKLVRVEYEELPGVFDLEEAKVENSKRVHSEIENNFIEHSHHLLRSGDVEKGFKEAEVILERTYRTQFVDQAYIEPEAVIVLPDPYKIGVEIHGSIQNPYTIRENVATVLGLKINQVRVIQSTIGGSFGGKDESVMLMAARCAVIALKTGRPVKMVLTREESFLESSKRHPFQANYKIGAKKDGSIVAVENKVYVQGGAYNNKASFANWRASIHAAGPYTIPHIKTDIYGLYTHTIYGGAYRGFSAPQMVFATESLIDELAEELKMSPQEIRLKNCLKPGDEMGTGQILLPGKIPAPLEKMIREICRKTDFESKRKKYIQEREGFNPLKKGIGLSCTFRGAGLGGEGIDTASATVTIDIDGSILIQSGLVEMGQGMRTAHAQIVAEVLGVSLDRITFGNTDTAVTMDSGATVASRGILAGGNAMLIAATELLQRLHQQASIMLNCNIENLISENEFIFNKSKPDKKLTFEEVVKECLKGQGLSLSAQGWYNPGPEKLSPETGRGKAYPTYSYGTAVAELRVDVQTGKINVEKITAAYEIGKAINPQIAKSQFYGGILQGVGYAIMEEMRTKDGYLKTKNFDDFLIPSSADMPEMEVTIYESDDPVGPFGAKSVGELGIELIAPALANALYNATGKRIRELPLNLERVLLGKTLKK